MQKLLEFQSKTLSKTVYHGTGARFKEFSQDKSRVLNDFFGGGVAYFTTDMKIAIGYAKSAAKRAPDKTGRIYVCKLTLKKIFDVDAKFTGEELVNLLPKDLDSFARGAGLMRLGSDPHQTLSDLRRGSISLSGKEVFDGLSRGMVNTSKARDYLKAHGYDGLRYNGGELMGLPKHSVYIAYYAKDIDIEARKKLT
jgi:hypothetical protein